MSNTIVVGFFFAATVLGIGYFLYDYNIQANINKQQYISLYATAMEHGFHPMDVRCAIESGISPNNLSLSMICMSLVSSSIDSETLRKLQEDSL